MMELDNRNITEIEPIHFLNTSLPINYISHYTMALPKSKRPKFG